MPRALMHANAVTCWVPLARLAECTCACWHVQQAESVSEAPASRWLSAAGNALFFGALGGTAYFGYYTLRYSTPEMAQLIDERKQPEHAFPGSQVSVYTWKTAPVRHLVSILFEELPAACAWEQSHLVCSGHNQHGVGPVHGSRACNLGFCEACGVVIPEQVVQAWGR